MKEWEMISAIESMEARHFSLFMGGFTQHHCEGCGQIWPCKTEQTKQALVSEIRRLKKLESDHV